MTAWLVHRFADLVGLPGRVVFELAVWIRSPELGRAGLALIVPGLYIHLFALYLAD